APWPSNRFGRRPAKGVAGELASPAYTMAYPMPCKAHPYIVGAGLAPPLCHVPLQFFLLLNLPPFPLISFSLHLQQPHIQLIDQWLIYQGMGFQKTQSISTKASLEQVHAPEFLAFF